MPELYSRNLASADYDQETHVLTIGFRSGAVYEYAGVPEWVYGQLVQSIDAGGFFQAYIDKVYQYERTV